MAKEYKKGYRILERMHQLSDNRCRQTDNKIILTTAALLAEIL